MRVGFNPQKDKKVEQSECFHQVIVPVYIPNQEGYFKDALTILKYCLESLLCTSHKKTYITLVNNGSCVEVAEYLVSLYESKQIHELIHSTSIGKLNSVLKGSAGHSFPLVTVSDSDVLFLTGWQVASYQLFHSFPKAGAICPTPSSRSFKTFTSNIYWDLFFSNSIKFRAVKNPDALKAFGHSVGDKDFYNEIQLKKYLTISNNKCTAVVGAGHFLTTYRGCIFDNNFTRFSNFKMGGNSETDLLDLPVVKKDFWRLSTEDNYAYHMGNVLEDWMEVTLNKQKEDFNTAEINCPNFTFYGNIKACYWLKTKMFSRIIFNKRILKMFFKSHGLSDKRANEYLF